MTKSHSDMPEIKRQWSILPVRALLDRGLKEREFRTLAALCIFTNSYGVCWPGVTTLSAIIDCDKATISRVLNRLVSKGYVRKLKPSDYQMEFAKFGKISRYQVLYEPDAPLPSWEEVQSAIVLAPVEDQPDPRIKDMGSGVSEALVSLSHSLTHAYLRAVQRRTGQTRRFDNEINHARRLAEQGATVDQVTAATEALCLAYLAERRGIPSLADVARQGVTETNERLP